MEIIGKVLKEIKQQLNKLRDTSYPRIDDSTDLSIFL